jgi:hypothetical protein
MMNVFSWVTWKQFWLKPCACLVFLFFLNDRSPGRGSSEFLALIAQV